jgi:hypothetical protein
VQEDTGTDTCAVDHTSSCTTQKLLSSRFAGKPKEDVEAFVNAITVYQECVDISDDNALKGLPMLLNDLAATWFQGSKSLHKTWTEAVAALQNAFGKKLRPHRVFRKLFAEAAMVLDIPRRRWYFGSQPTIRYFYDLNRCAIVNLRDFSRMF